MISQASSTFSSRVPTYIATAPVVDVLVDVGADGVGEPALLADLAEEARRARAAERGVEHAEREPPLVAAGDAPAAEADVVLLGVLGIEEQARLALGARRRSPARGRAGAPSRSGAARQARRCCACSRWPAAATTTVSAV